MSAEKQIPEPVVSPALKALVIGMGVLIVLGTAGLIFVIVQRLTHGPSRTAAPVSVAAGTTQLHAGVPVLLHEPEGSRIVSLMRQSSNVIAVQLSGGGPDRIVLWDIARNDVAGRLSLAQ